MSSNRILIEKFMVVLFYDFVWDLI